MNIGNWIAIVSLLVALLALFRTWKIDRSKSTKNKRAIIRAKGYLSDGLWTINIRNDGAASAKNIKMEFKDIRSDRRTPLFIEKGKLPYPLLNGGDGFELRAMLGNGRNPAPKIKFIWDDDYKNDNEREQILEL
jgi:hypothetical protein